MKTLLTFYIVSFLKEKRTMVWVIVMPLIFAVFFGMVFRGTSGGSHSEGLVSILNHDSGPIGEELSNFLKKKNFDVRSTVVPNTIATIEIPETFTSGYMNGTPPDIRVTFPADVAGNRPAQLKMYLAQFTLRMIRSAIWIREHHMVTDDFHAVFSRAPGVTLKKTEGERKVIPAGFSLSFPGNLIMFVMLNILIYGGITLRQDMESGITRRTLVAPISKTGFITASVLFRTIIGVFQALIILVAGQLFFHVNYLTASIWLLPLITLFSLAIASLSMLLATTVRNPDRISTAAIILTLPLAALGGCWWPLEIVPKFWQKIAWYLPTGNIRDVFSKLFIHEIGFTDIASNAAYLVVLPVILTVAAVYRLKRNMT
ncbi:MAG: ABC transporter permease [Acidobacteria bacterium]|nr:ABC transporter permease [Acidobacteriota bacterium]